MKTVSSSFRRLRAPSDQGGVGKSSRQVSELRPGAISYGPVLLPILLFTHCLLFFSGAIGCRSETRSGADSGATLVFKHGKVSGADDALGKLLRKFEMENPGITVRSEDLPSESDAQHQFYVINLEGHSDSFDVLAIDVIWVQAFARAGWLLPLPGLLTPEETGDFFEAPLQAATWKGQLTAVPWFIDSGLLYYRDDLLKKYGLAPPTTWEELRSEARTITEGEAGMYGFVWQGKQYEGLVCNILEYLWSAGGEVLRGNRSILDSPENIRALRFVRKIIFDDAITPESITTLTEEPSRHLFGNGKAVFMRNWPYAWRLFQTEDWPVKGKIGVSPLPAFAGGRSASTLGGWHLALNRFSKHPQAAKKLLRFLNSPEAARAMAIAYGYHPPRKSLYVDPELLSALPYIKDLFPIFERAHPRPLTPYYMMLSQVLQPEFSAVISGLKSPEAALRSAGKEIDFFLKDSTDE